MSERVTSGRMARVLANYAATLAGHGWVSEADASRITWGSPYGQMIYVMTNRLGGDVHNVPGFHGSGGSGFATLREGYERVSQSWRVLSELGDELPYDNDKAKRVHAAVLAAHKIKDEA